MKTLLLTLVGSLLWACGIAPSRTPDPLRFDLGPVRDLVWIGQEKQALVQLDALRWSQSGSVEAERLRQDLRLRRGDRLGVLEELSRWREERPADPDLAYLAARVLEDPVSRRDRFRSLLRRFPSHPWVRFGAIATAQQMGDWNRARTWLQSIRPDSLPSAYHHVLEARQLRHQGDPQAGFDRLQADAFEQGLDSALNEYLAIALEVADGARQRRAIAEIEWRRAGDGKLAPAEAIDLAFSRLQAEWPWCRTQDLTAILADFDHWLEGVGAPAGWASHPRYSLAGFARLVKPESSSGAVAQAWAETGRFLLAGSAWGRGNEIHLLKGTLILPLAWPGHEQPIQMVFAEGVESTVSEIAQGGTVFRGFYVLRDRVERGAGFLRRRLGRFESVGGRVVTSELVVDRLESLDLAQRLRRDVLKDSGFKVEDLELIHICLHESGHFEEILTWLDFGLPLWELLPALLASNQRFGDPLLWLEYRAQLRALSSGRIPLWIFAETLERGQDPYDPYYRPYRKILTELVDLAEEQGLPPLALWDSLSPNRLVWLARELCKRGKLNPLDPQGTEALMQALVQADFFHQVPSDRAISD